MRVEYRNTQKEVDFSINRVSLRNLSSCVLAFEKRSCDLLSIYFISDRKMREYHKQFFQDPSSTDCISIPLDSNFHENVVFRYLGEVFVCPKTAIDYVTKHPHLNFWEELSLYLVHGLLHLLGYDDSTPSMKSVMRRKERKIVSHLRKNGLLLSGTFRSSP